MDRSIEKEKDQIEIYTNKTTSGASHSSPDKSLAYSRFAQHSSSSCLPPAECNKVG